MRQARNPINGLVYGYGGLKLVRRSHLRQLRPAVDVLAGLPGKTEFTPALAGTTRIDQSPYHAWKAGFRECAMLSRGSEYGMNPARARSRINAWLHDCTGPLAKPAMIGAAAGIAFAATAAGQDGMEAINDPH